MTMFSLVRPEEVWCEYARDFYFRTRKPKGNGRIEINLGDAFALSAGIARTQDMKWPDRLVWSKAKGKGWSRAYFVTQPSHLNMLLRGGGYEFNYQRNTWYLSGYVGGVINLIEISPKCFIRTSTWGMTEFVYTRDRKLLIIGAMEEG